MEIQGPSLNLVKRFSLATAQLDTVDGKEPTEEFSEQFRYSSAIGVAFVTEDGNQHFFMFSQELFQQFKNHVRFYGPADL